MADVAAPEPLRFEGLVNVRDLGGHPTARGRLTKWGRVLRADGVHRATPADLASLERLGVRRVVDLRTTSERLEDGAFDEGHAVMQYAHVALFDEPRVRGDDEAPPPEPNLYELYLRIIDQRGDRVVTAIDAVVGAPGAAVVHCTVGKDRTGIVVACMLAAVGVPDEAIARDYVVSAANMAALVEWYRTHRPTPEGGVATGIQTARAMRMLAAEPSWMHDLLEHVRSGHGSMRDYLRANGASDETLEALDRRLLG